MNTNLSASGYDALVGAGNYFFLRGYECNVGPYFVQVLDEVSLVKQQINRLNILLKLLYENWHILPFVVNVDGKPAVFVTRESGLLPEAQEFPHARFAALVNATERVAQIVANPGESEDKYFASDKTGVPTSVWLIEARVSEEAVRDTLPALAVHASQGVDILVRHASGTARPIVLPPTEEVRKPHDGKEPTDKKDGFWGKVAGIMPVYGYVVLEDGFLVKIYDREPEEFVVGKTYFFRELRKRSQFSKSLRHASSDMATQGDVFE